MKFEELEEITQESIFVESLLNSPAKLKLLTGNIGLDKLIKNKDLHRPQLALAGFVELFNHNQIQIIGNTEYFYLKSLSKQQRINSIKNLAQFDIPCVIITNGREPFPEFLQIAKEHNIPVFSTDYNTTKAINLLSEYLDDQFAPHVVVHGSFVDVYGVGVLFIGKSGIGKSEIALDLVERGHRLVADDIVMLTKKRETIIMGTGTSLVQHFMEIRGLGIIDVRQMFGIRAIRFQKRLEIIVELEEWSQSQEYTRTGLDETYANIMGVEISMVKLPIIPGKNITVIAEVIAINYLLRTYGYNAAKVFTDNLKDAIKKRSAGPQRNFQDKRLINYFQGDNE